MFCREYLIDLNATQAALRAGYSERTAICTASENLSKPDIKSMITGLKAQRNDLVGINSIYIQNRLIVIDPMEVLNILASAGKFETVSQRPTLCSRRLSGLVWEGLLIAREVPAQK